MQGGAVDSGVEPEVVDADRDLARFACFVRGRMTARQRCVRAPGRAAVGWFIAVGCAAAALHLGVVVVLVGAWAMAPLAANVVGWLIAFGVSFAGHHYLTFAHHGAPLARAAGRFFFVSAAGFAVNEAAYAALLRWSPLRYDLGLALVLLAVAAATYWLGRHWAFLRIEAR